MDTINRVILITAVSIAAIAIIYGIIRYTYCIRHEHFVCPKCHKTFKPKVKSLVFSENAVEGKVLKCSFCGVKEYMEPQKDQNK